MFVFLRGILVFFNGGKPLIAGKSLYLALNSYPQRLGLLAKVYLMNLHPNLRDAPPFSSSQLAF